MRGVLSILCAALLATQSYSIVSGIDLGNEFMKVSISGC